MTLGALSDKLNTLQGQMNVFARLSLEEREDEILDLQKLQLFQGQTREGQDIRPYYTEDLKANGGFFKSVESAMKYARYKATSIAYPVDVRRNPDAPNLYINGRLVHANIGLEFSDEYMFIKGMTPEVALILKRYGEETLGLSDESMDKIMPKIKESVIEQLKEYING